MEPFEDDKLVATMESLRPQPREEFAAELDERAADGFPRRGGGGASPWARFIGRLRGAEQRRLVLPVLAGALTAIVLVTGAIVFSSGGGGSSQHGSEVLGLLNKTDVGSAEESPTSSDAASEEAASGSSASGEATTESSGPYAADARHRSVERGAEITLGTEPGEVGKAAGKVLGTVHQYDGIVLDSSVRGGSEGEARASFTLLIPSAKLADALASFSEIAEVRARHETSNDITAPTVTTGERLIDSHARVESLLNQLAAAETEAEQLAVEARLRAERRHQARLKSQLSALRRRANLSRVSLKIVSNEAPAAGGGGWDAGSAFHDAGHILSVAAGVLIVALAVLAPLALLVLLAWLAHRAWLRGRRERALS